MSVSRDARGVSTAVTHALAIGISSLLVMTLLFGLGGFLDGQEKSAVDRQTLTIGERVSTELTKAERLAIGDPSDPADDSEVRLRVAHPERVAGYDYEVVVADDDAPNCPGSGNAWVDICVSVVPSGGEGATRMVELELDAGTRVVGDSQRVAGSEFTIVITPDGSGNYDIELEA